MGPKPVVKVEVGVRIPPPPIVGSFGVLSSFHDSMEGVFGDLQISLSISYKQERRGKLPQKLKGNDCSPTTGYAPYCPNAECH